MDADAQNKEPLAYPRTSQLVRTVRRQGFVSMHNLSDSHVCAVLERDRWHFGLDVMQLIGDEPGHR